MTVIHSSRDSTCYEQEQRLFVTVSFLCWGYFLGFRITREFFRKALLVELLDDASEIDGLPISQITPEVLAEVA